MEPPQQQPVQLALLRDRVQRAGQPTSSTFVPGESQGGQRRGQGGVQQPVAPLETCHY